MIIEIINIGDELLIGQVTNTNASWIGEQLNLNGFKTYRFTVIGDNRQHILEALSDAERRADLVLLSGGIGPTRDDITKPALCEFFSTRLVFNEDAYRDIEELFARRGLRVTELNRLQAEIPENCILIINRLGTARGMWFEKQLQDGRKVIFISMPGVPFEMKAMFTKEIIPRLKSIFTPQTIIHKTILTQGIGESFLAKLIEEWENAIPKNITLAYLPQPGIVRLRLTASGDDSEKVREQVENEVKKLLELIPAYFFGFDEDTLEGITGNMLAEKKLTLSTAESCTGGYIAHLITSVPGSSRYYKGSCIAYSNDIKISELNIDLYILEQFGAVSEQVVKEMALSARKKFNTDFVIATSGIAGPTGGTIEKPVGTTWIAIASPEKVTTYQYLFGDNRERNIRRTSMQALNLLRKEIIEYSSR